MRVRLGNQQGLPACPPTSEITVDEDAQHTPHLLALHPVLSSLLGGFLPAVQRLPQAQVAQRGTRRLDERALIANSSACLSPRVE